MTRAPLELCSEARDGGALDLALSRAVLDEVASARRPETLRLYRPSDLVAFSATDRHSSGFEAAVEVARRLEFDAALRLAGGSAALFQRESLAFAWSVPSRDPRRGIRKRFEAISSWVATALVRLGVDARVGEVAGEYCPGEYSVNASGVLKLMGVGQRIVRGAAHVGGVIIVRRSDRTRRVLTPVYRALELPFEPATVGAVDDEIPGIGIDDVSEALLSVLAERRSIVRGTLGTSTLETARALGAHYRLA